MVNDPAGVAETATLDQVGAGRPAGPYLLVVEQGSSAVVPLPVPGIVTIGRGADCDLRLDHASVSRRHARIVVEPGEIRVSDLDSHNGTRVNGQPLAGGRAVKIGDVIAVGEVILVVHGQLARRNAQVVLDGPAWRRRLSQEVERALSFQRPLAVLAVSGTREITGLRAIDVLGVDEDDDQHTLALLPEADADAALQLAALVAAGGGRVGVATCPADATDADSLVLAACAAAGVAAPGQVGRAAETAQRRRFGEREVLLCHPAMLRVYDLLERLGASDLPVLILGETGVGKENAAYAVHAYSPRKAGPFVVLNCGALAETLVASELFGHAKGAFTGATSARAGVFEAASGGTLFLDEVGELPPAVQAKLLRALETQRITRVGETQERPVDLRIVAATNRVLDEDVAAGRFRQDLYFRLGAARVHLPPLRDRPCEIPVLFRELLARAAARAGREPPVPSTAVMRCLMAHAWPGNVRELKHVADFVLATAPDDRIEPDDLPPELVGAPVEPPAARDAGSPRRRLADELEELERLRMTEALAQTGGIKTRAAALLGMPIRTFNLKFRRYKL